MKTKTNNNITMSFLLEAVMEKVKRDLNCIKIGKVVNFYPDDKTADVEIQFKMKETDGSIIDYPLLLKCLVLGNKITTPIEIGEYCIIFFNDVNLDSFFENGQKQVPYTRETHNISDGIVLMGLNNLINKIEYDNTAICLNYELNKIKGQLEVSGETKIKDNTEIEKNVEIKQDLEVKGNVNSTTYSVLNQPGWSGYIVDTPSGTKWKVVNGIIVSQE